jgi:ribosomal protein S14
MPPDDAHPHLGGSENLRQAAWRTDGPFWRTGGALRKAPVRRETQPREAAKSLPGARGALSGVVNAFYERRVPWVGFRCVVCVFTYAYPPEACAKCASGGFRRQGRLWNAAHTPPTAGHQACARAAPRCATTLVIGPVPPPAAPGDPRAVGRLACRCRVCAPPRGRRQDSGACRSVLRLELATPSLPAVRLLSKAQSQFRPIHTSRHKG